MSDFPTPNKGDRVRVVLEGEVTHVSCTTEFDVKVAGDKALPNAIQPWAQHVKSIEILPEPLKVGDTVVVAERNDDLPVGTVLRGPAGDVLVRKWDGWKTAGATGTYPSDGLNATRTILWLPKS